MYYGQSSPLTNYFSHTLGMFRALMESHRPVQVLIEYDLENGDLQGIKVLALPNVACLSDRAIEVIRRFVRNDGGLVATYEKSLFDQTGKKRTDFAPGDLFHASYLGTHFGLTRDDALPMHIVFKHPIIEQSLWTSAPPDHSTFNQLSLVAGAVETKTLSEGQSLVTFQEKYEICSSP